MKTEIAVFNNSVNNWSSAYIAPSGYNWKISEQPYIIEWDAEMLGNYLRTGGPTLINGV